MSADVHEETLGTEALQELKAPFLYKGESSEVVEAIRTPFVTRTGETQGYERVVIGYKEVITRQPPVETTPSIVYIVQEPKPAPLPAYVPNYCCLSVFVMLCCCLPLGLAALLVHFCSQERLAQGHVEEALKKARTSRILNIFGIICGLVIIVISMTVRFTS